MVQQAATIRGRAGTAARLGGVAPAEVVLRQQHHVRPAPAPRSVGVQDGYEGKVQMVTRRGRTRAAVVVIIGSSAAALTAWSSIAAPATAQDADRDLVDRGAAVFQTTCAACHGTRGEGRLAGSGVTAGPPLRGIDVAYLDMTVRTGRMPIAHPSMGVYEEQLDEEERIALVAYAVGHLELTGSIPQVNPGDASRGQELFVRNCAACHGAAAGGGISGAQAFVPPLVGVDRVAIAEATRVGPFEMPAFDAAVLSDQDIDDVIGYLDVVDGSPRTLIGLREADQAVSGLLTIGLGIVATLVLFIVARARRWYRFEPGGYHDAPPFEPRS